jgi:hypothetical protein
MARVHIERFYPDEPGDRGFEGHFQVAAASQPVDQPGGQPPTLDGVITNFRSPQIGFGPQLHWIAVVDGHTVGSRSPTSRKPRTATWSFR